MSEVRRRKPPAIPVVRVRRSTDESAKELICWVLAVAGGQLQAKTRLYKAFYAAHLVYHRQTNDFLTGHPIVHMPHGPGIDEGDRLLAELQRDGIVSITDDRRDVFPEQIFHLQRAFSLDPADPRFEAVATAVRWVESKSAAELSAETHEKSRSWNTTSNGEEMNIYLDLLTDEEIAQRDEALRRAGVLVSAAFDQ